MDVSTSNFRVHTNLFPKQQFLNAETDTQKSEGLQGNNGSKTKKNKNKWEREFETQLASHKLCFCKD